MTVDLLPELVANYREWEKSHRDPNGLFWQIDDRDGMEFSIGGSGYRPTINSYRYGDAMAVSEIATRVWPRRADLAPNNAIRLTAGGAPGVAMGRRNEPGSAWNVNLMVDSSTARSIASSPGA